jgi:cation:H+ antiporter
MIWAQFAATALVIVLAGVRLARYGDVLGEKTGLGRSWIGVVLLAATTSLPELFTGFGATALAPLPDIALGDVLGSCMFNLLILSLMDAVQAEPLSARAHQGHALSIGFGLLLIGVAGTGLLASGRIPAIGWIGLYSPVLIGLYFVAMRVIFAHERQLGEAFVGSLFVAITTSLPEIVVSLTAVRIGALDLGIGNVLGSNLFNLLILGLDDVFYRQGPLMADAGTAHSISVVAIVMMNALFLIGLTYKALTKRFLVTWDSAAIGGVYVVAVALSYLLTG